MRTTVQVVIAILIFISAITLQAFPQESGSITVTVSPGPYEIENVPQGHEIVMDSFGRHLVPGAPDLPARIFAVAVPPGSNVREVAFESEEAHRLPGAYRIKPVPLPRVIGGEDPDVYEQERRRFDANYNALYSSDAPYPGTTGELVRFAGYRKYNLVDVRITPFTYHPRSGALIHHPKIKIVVSYDMPEHGSLEAYISDELRRTEAVARDIILNYDKAQSWYAQSGSLGCRGLYDFVIITLDTLTAEVQPLVDWESAKGRNVNVVTTAWIDTNYAGYDLAEKMRNFLRDKYPSSEWGIEDVCLVGHYDDVPMRRCWQNVGYGNPETDYYYAELSKPDSQSWDKDKDHKWGEGSDPIDFYAEVNVGRIPWSDPGIVKSICQKSTAFENTSDPSFKKNILLLGAFFWPDTDNAVLMEYKTDAGKHPWMSDWTMTRMYEQGYTKYSFDYNLVNTNVKSIWSKGKYAFVNWAGHGSPTSCHVYYAGGAFVGTNTCPSLNDDYPAIIFADACSNSDTDTLNLGQAMLEQGGVGFLGATKVAYGTGNWNHPNDGSSQSLDYYFTTCVTSMNYTQGQAHQWSLRKMYTDGLWYKTKYEMFEWGALWGNPNLGLGTEPALVVNFPEGLPQGVHPPGPATVMTVQIQDGYENYVPGTAQLHYRFDPEDPYTAAALTSLGGDLYEAVLPNTKPNDAPEFYFSAQGDGGTTFCSPYHAPDKAYSFEVYLTELLVEDDFESDLGWEVLNWFVDDGGWELADPAGTFDKGVPVQPEDDHSPYGTKCFVTGGKGGAVGDDDLDGELTMLTSPSFDLPNDGLISFYLWFYHSKTGQQEPLEIFLYHNGPYIKKVTSLMHDPEWNLISFRLSDYVAPSEEIRLFLRVMDGGNDSIVEALIDDFTVKRFVTDPSLWADAYSIAESSGAPVNFSLHAGAAHGSRSYVLLGSFSGTEPGTLLPGGQVTLPLNWDSFTDFVWSSVNSPLFMNFMGTMDGDGRATAQMNLGPLPSGSAGIRLYFAFTLYGPCDFVSNPITIEITD